MCLLRWQGLIVEIDILQILDHSDLGMELINSLQLLTHLVNPNPLLWASALNSTDNWQPCRLLNRCNSHWHKRTLWRSPQHLDWSPTHCYQLSSAGHTSQPQVSCLHQRYGCAFYIRWGNFQHCPPATTRIWVSHAVQQEPQKRP